jgi:hypothetical protein
MLRSAASLGGAGIGRDDDGIIEGVFGVDSGKS